MFTSCHDRILEKSRTRTIYFENILKTEGVHILKAKQSRQQCVVIQLILCEGACMKLSAMCRKILEMTICRRVEAFLGEEGLSDHQFVFRKARSTIDALKMGLAKNAASTSWEVTRSTTLWIGMPNWLI